jgi:type IV pilus assembly protein PilN
MMEINLLPWRAQKRAQEKKQFIIFIVSCAFMALCAVALLHYYLDYLVNIQEERNRILEQEITMLKEPIQEIKELKLVRQGLMSKLSLVYTAQSTRIVLVHLFAELGSLIPQGVYLSKIKRHKNWVTIWGYSDSDISVSSLLNNMQHNDWIQTPSLAELKNIQGRQSQTYKRFIVRFILKPENKLGNEV